MNRAIYSAISAPPEHRVRLADDAEMQDVATILGSAFSDDPVMNWMCPASRIYPSLFRAEAEGLYRFHGQVYLNQEKTGAAMWLPAGVSSRPPLNWRWLAVIVKLWCSGGPESIRRAQQIEACFAEYHLKEPHFYLHCIGAQLGNQGRGIGSSLLRAGLEACDELGLPAYLESSNEKNNPLYQRFGFVITGETRLPDDGPTVWFMRREARG